MRSRCTRIVLLVVLILLGHPLLRPADAVVAAEARVRDVLEAEAAGDVVVRYIPNDSRSAQIVVTNRTDRPLTLRLPDAFVGVPVLAQIGGMGMGGMGGMGGGMGGNVGGGGFGGGGMQAAGGGGMGGMGMGMGGGMGGMGGGMGGMGGAGGAFAIPPEKPAIVRVQTVCLEYGKAEPRPNAVYRLLRCDAFTQDAGIARVLEALGRGQISQSVAQAAAWHLASGRTWDQLAAERVRGWGSLPDRPVFSRQDLEGAMRVVALVEEESVSTGSSASTSRESAVSFATASATAAVGAGGSAVRVRSTASGR
jgi:hypothetical protein